MKFLKWFGIILGSLIVLFLVIALFLPSETSLSAEKEIAVSPGPLFHNLATFTDRQVWDPWLTMDPDAEVEISSTDDYVGSYYTWNGELIGSGRMEVRSARFPDLIKSKIWFGESPDASDVRWEISEGDEGARVKWTFSSSGKYPFGRYMLLLMKGPLTSSFETGLEQLKEYVEANPPKLHKLSDISIERSYDTWAMVYPAKVTIDDMGEKMVGVFQSLMASIQEQGLELNGPAFLHVTSMNSETGVSDVFFAFPVKSKGKTDGVIAPKFYPAIEAVSATQTGLYEYFPESYEAIQEYITENDIDVTGEVFEVYLSTMMDSENPMDWRTMIAFPLKK